MGSTRMGWRLMAAAALLVGASAAARAQGFEAASAGAQQAFYETQVLAAPRFVQAPRAIETGFPTPDLGNIVRDRIAQVRLISAVDTRAAAGPAQRIDLTTLLNRHFKTDQVFTLSGVQVWVSGTFDRAQKAYVSVLIDGKADQLYNVEDLVKTPQTLQIGSATYQLKVFPDLSDLLDSEIALVNKANRKDEQRLTLRDMLTSVAAAGQSATVSGDAYKVFYYDDVKDGHLDSATRSFAFIKTDAQGQFHVFLVPAELVPADKIAIFTMHDNKSVGLQRDGDTLLIYQQP